MITGSHFAQMVLSAANHLYNNKDLIDKLNVFPVPDGDTGKNMYLTMAGAAQAAEAMGSCTISDAADKVAYAALKSARGNSGVILSQLFRGIAKTVKGATEMDARLLVQSFEQAQKTAYMAVMKPTEGTVLTVAREGADAARRAGRQTQDITQIFRAMVEGANQSLQKTPDLLPKLKEAGVVDAGGKGWTCILEGMLYYLEHNTVISKNETEASAQNKEPNLKEETEITYGYCTEFIIEKADQTGDVDAFRKYIRSLGDSMVVVEDFEIVKVHIHTDNPGVVLQEALQLGALTDIKIDNMRKQHNERLNLTQQAPKKECALVAVCAGKGFSDILKELGIDEIIEGGQTMNPSAGDLLDAIGRTNANTVYILPNNKNIILAAQQAKEMAKVHVEIIPTKSVPEGIAAAIAYASDASAQENVKQMTNAMEAVSTGQVTYAVRDTEINGKQIHTGDIIGLSGGSIVACGSDTNDTAFQLVREMATEDSSVITIYYGEDITDETAANLCADLENQYGDLDILAQYGGQPVYYYTISVE